MLRAKRTTKSPYARPGRAPAATKKAKASRPTSTVTQPSQVTPATSTVTQPNQVTTDAIPTALSNQPSTSSGIDIPDPSEFEASPTMLSPASLCAMMINGGMHRRFGILFVEFRKKFDSSSADMSIVVSVQIAVMSISGLFLMTVGMKYFSSRQCVTIGGFFVTTSLILSTFAKNVTHLVFTHSVLIGFGLAAVLGPSLTITGQYFDSKRGIANGLHTAAASFGALVLAPVFRYFIDAFILKGALLILAGLAFHIVPAGMLLRPPELYKKWVHQKNTVVSSIFVEHQFSWISLLSKSTNLNVH